MTTDKGTPGKRGRKPRTVKGTKPNDELARRMRHLRVDVLGVDRQEEFASVLGVTRSAVGSWEAGRGVRRETLQKIAGVYSVNFDWLLTGIGAPLAGETTRFEQTIRSMVARGQLPQEQVDQWVLDAIDLMKNRVKNWRKRLKEDEEDEHKRLR